MRLATRPLAEHNSPRKRRRKSSSHGYPGVRGGQGRGRNKFQGCLPGKVGTTVLFDKPEEAAAALELLKEEKRAAEQKVPIGELTRLLQPKQQALPALPALAAPRVIMMPRVSIGRAMWPLPVGSNPNLHGCEVVVAQPLRA